MKIEKDNISEKTNAVFIYGVFIMPSNQRLRGINGDIITINRK